jgi:hypothetical protein
VNMQMDSCMHHESSVYAHVHACTHIHMHAHIHTYDVHDERSHLHAYTHIHTHSCIHMCAYIHTSTHGADANMHMDSEAHDGGSVHRIHS